ncbi:uridine kinase [Candidatus Calescamantes bacterium]|nr:uridine kinase [Candidatus Calescamantes bacterium]MCK5599509.1 uridine kinase [bacterium]
MNKPFIIGIAGGTGSGKTTVARKIHEIMKQNMVVIYQDSYYTDMRDIPVDERNYDHPNAFDTDLLITQIKQLKKGEPIEVPIYDFKTHSRKEKTQSLTVAPVVVLEGILIFHFPELRELMDFKIYVDTPSDIRLSRRITRDIKERGRDMDSVMKQYLSTVRPMHIEFVSPSKKFADIIVPEGGYNERAIDFMVSSLKHKWNL